MRVQREIPDEMLFYDIHAKISELVSLFFSFPLRFSTTFAAATDTQHNKTTSERRLDFLKTI
jgi:hypothetical protein